MKIKGYCDNCGKIMSKCECGNAMEMREQMPMSKSTKIKGYCDDCGKLITKCECVKKAEAKEVMDAGASGSFEAPIGMPILKRDLPNYKQKINEMDGIPAMPVDGPIGTAGPSTPMDKKKKRRKDPLALDEKGKTASITAASTDDMISTKKGFPRFGGPDAKFVEIDARCKTFPYCNQGAQGQLKFISEIDGAIEEAAKKYGLSIVDVQKMVIREMVQANEVLPRGIFDDPSNIKAFKSWTDKGPATVFHIQTEEPLNVHIKDDIDLAKLKLIFYKYDIKFKVDEIKN